MGQNKALYDLDRQTVKISALPSGNVNKYKLLNNLDVLKKKTYYKKLLQ